ncbi:hypothetical protein TNCV_4531741 [Trichonephila clavipes]|nr:hypothetical protein TNCV_4531741 [Trichonephila clavipes]
MIESITNVNEFRSKDETVVRIPDADFNIVPRSVTKNTTPCSTRIRTTTICVNNQGLIGVAPYRRIPITAGNFGSVSSLKTKIKHLLWLSVYQNLITLVPFWITETGYCKGERNVRWDLTPEWRESYQ